MVFNNLEKLKLQTCTQNYRAWYIVVEIEQHSADKIKVSIKILVVRRMVKDFKHNIVCNQIV